MPAQANKGKDPYSEPPRGRRRAPADAEDPDLETVGLVLQGTRLYFLGGVLLAASAASPVLIKARARCVLGQKAGQEGTCGHAPLLGRAFRSNARTLLLVWAKSQAPFNGPPASATCSTLTRCQRRAVRTRSGGRTPERQERFA